MLSENLRSSLVFCCFFVSLLWLGPNGRRARKDLKDREVVLLVADDGDPDTPDVDVDEPNESEDRPIVGMRVGVSPIEPIVAEVVESVL